MELRRSVEIVNLDCLDEYESSDDESNIPDLFYRINCDTSSCSSDSCVEPPSSFTRNCQSLIGVNTPRCDKINDELCATSQPPAVGDLYTASNDKYSIDSESVQSILKEARHVIPIEMDQDLDMDFSCIPKELKDSLSSVDQQPNDDRLDFTSNQVGLKVQQPPMSSADPSL